MCPLQLARPNERTGQSLFRRAIPPPRSDRLLRFLMFRRSARLRYYKNLSLRIGNRYSAVSGSNPTEHRRGCGVRIEDTRLMSFENCARVDGTGLGTLDLTLFKSLGLPGTPQQPAEKPLDVLVYGGGTSIGTMAIQLLKLYVYLHYEYLKR